jgi:hypothetical protein
MTVIIKRQWGNEHEELQRNPITYFIISCGYGPFSLW